MKKTGTDVRRMLISARVMLVFARPMLGMLMASVIWPEDSTKLPRNEGSGRFRTFM